MITLDAVEKLALGLSEQQRATLAMHMIHSLPALFSEQDGGRAEAERRDSEMDTNPGISLSLEDFDKKIARRKSR